MITNVLASQLLSSYRQSENAYVRRAATAARLLLLAQSNPNLIHALGHLEDVRDVAKEAPRAVRRVFKAVVKAGKKVEAKDVFRAVAGLMVAAAFAAAVGHPDARAPSATDVALPPPAQGQVAPSAPTLFLGAPSSTGGGDDGGSGPPAPPPDDFITYALKLSAVSSNTPPPQQVSPDDSVQWEEVEGAAEEGEQEEGEELEAEDEEGEVVNSDDVDGGRKATVTGWTIHGQVDLDVATAYLRDLIPERGRGQWENAMAAMASTFDIVRPPQQLLEQVVDPSSDRYPRLDAAYAPTVASSVDLLSELSRASAEAEYTWGVASMALAPDDATVLKMRLEMEERNRGREDVQEERLGNALLLFPEVRAAAGLQHSPLTPLAARIQASAEWQARPLDEKIVAGRMAFASSETNHPGVPKEVVDKVAGELRALASDMVSEVVDITASYGTDVPIARVTDPRGYRRDTHVDEEFLRDSPPHNAYTLDIRLKEDFKISSLPEWTKGRTKDQAIEHAKEMVMKGLWPHRLVKEPASMLASELPLMEPPPPLPEGDPAQRFHDLHMPIHSATEEEVHAANTLTTLHDKLETVDAGDVAIDADQLSEMGEDVVALLQAAKLDIQRRLRSGEEVKSGDHVFETIEDALTMTHRATKNDPDLPRVTLNEAARQRIVMDARAVVSPPASPPATRGTEQEARKVWEEAVREANVGEDSSLVTKAMDGIGGVVNMVTTKVASMIVHQVMAQVVTRKTPQAAPLASILFAVNDLAESLHGAASVASSLPWAAAASVAAEAPEEIQQDLKDLVDHSIVADHPAAATLVEELASLPPTDDVKATVRGVADALKNGSVPEGETKDAMERVAQAFEGRRTTAGAYLMTFSKSPRFLTDAKRSVDAWTWLEISGQLSVVETKGIDSVTINFNSGREGELERIAIVHSLDQMETAVAGSAGVETKIVYSSPGSELFEKMEDAVMAMARGGGVILPPGVTLKPGKWKPPYEGGGSERRLWSIPGGGFLVPPQGGMLARCVARSMVSNAWLGSGGMAVPAND